MDVGTGVERYLRHHRAANSTVKTIRGYAWFLGRFADHVGPATALDALEAETLRDWIVALQNRGLSQHSVATMVRSVKTWVRWLVMEEYLDKDPFSRVKRPRCDDVAKPTFTPEEVDRLLAACKNTKRRSRTGIRDAALIMLLYSTGLRAAEAANLQLDDIDWDKGLIKVQRGKGGKHRLVPLGRKAERALTRYLNSSMRKPLLSARFVFLTIDGEPLTYAALVQAIEWRGIVAGVDANPHKFRHSAAVQYLRNGGRIEVLRTMLGHSSFRMTAHYARIAGVDLAEAHESADPTRTLKSRG